MLMNYRIDLQIVIILWITRGYIHIMNNSLFIAMNVSWNVEQIDRDKVDDAIKEYKYTSSMKSIILLILYERIHLRY